MAKLFSCGLFWQAAMVIAFRASAKRGYGSEPTPVKLKEVLKSGSSVICGGEEIWRMITVNPAVGSIQNINWLKISKTAEDYIYEQQQMVKGLEGEIQQLQRRIAEMKLREEATELPEEQVRELIKSGLKKFDEQESADAGLEVAQRTGCGHPSVRPRAPRPAYRQSPATFEEAAQEVFEEKKYRLNGGAFADVCAEMLECKDESCWCKPLCQKFRDIAQRLSDDTAGNLGTTRSAQLIDKQQEMMSALSHHNSEVEMCTADKENILAFSKHLTHLKEDMDEKFQGVQDAELALDDARWRVVDVGIMLEKEEAVLATAATELESAGEAYSEAAEALKVLQTDEETLSKHLDDTANSLRDGRLELENVESAERTVTAIKSYVTTVIAQMLFHLKSEVQDPIRALGITEDFQTGHYFPKDPGSLEAAKDVRDHVHKLYDFCATEAKEAFDAVAEELDLSPLCTVSDAEGTALSTDDSIQGLEKAIVDRSEQVKKELMELKSWLDPYRGQELTKEQVKEFIDAGEPQGLRELFNAYRHTTFYKYLEGWMAGGPLLKLTAELGETVETLKQMIAKFEEDLGRLESELAAAKTKREEAEQKLQEALERQEKAGQEHSAQKQILDDLVANRQTLEDGLKDLEELVREAKAKYQTAIDKLVESHTEATSLLQALQDSRNRFWEGQNRVDKQHIASLEAALSEAESHHWDVELQLQKQLSNQSLRSVGRHTS